MNSILGINAYHGDAAACLVVDGELVAAAEEERFRRIKHWAGFPAEAVRYCLRAGGLDARRLDHIAINRNPSANLLKKAMYSFANKPSVGAVMDRLRNSMKVRTVQQELADAMQIPMDEVGAQLHNIEHHRAHMASAFLVSPYRTAALVSVDGFGDFVSTMWGVGEDTRVTVRDEVNFPHSLGLFYMAMTQFLGFENYGDEYKVMGLAPYGKPALMDKLRQLIRPTRAGRFELDLDYFVHHSEGIANTWDGGEPKMGRAYSDALVALLGPPRAKGEPVTDFHRDLAASVQATYEELFFALLNHVHEQTGLPCLCLAGGCGMNSVANGKVFECTGFRDLYVQSAAGDAGGAIGAAYSVWNEKLGQPRSFVMNHAYLGPRAEEGEIAALLAARAPELCEAGCSIDEYGEEARLCQDVAAAIAEGAVVGWFQGRMEWGPRALGNRSILADPRRRDMKDILNLKIKRRESFRPFAPSILREAVGEWFETDYDVPFMLQVFQIRPEKRPLIPAVTHVNGSGRLQTVTEAQNRRYHALIREFGSQTGVPIVLNTSFNENEPVVCRPAEALDCFLRTKMDVLVLDNTMIRRLG